jgi:hypothetical protein
MATALFIFFPTKKFTIGWSRIENKIAKTTGTIIPRAIYNMVNRANRPIRIKIAFA